MHTLLTPLSLPQRLLRKALSPLAIGLLLAALLSVWTISGILETKTTVALSVTTSNTSTYYSLDSTNLHQLASTYIRKQRDQVQRHVTDYLAAQVFPDWRLAISSWNESLGTSVHAQRIMYSYILSCNESITNTLYDKSKQINESLVALEKTDLQIGTQNLSTLSVNFWFVSKLFENVSKNDSQLASLELDFPVVSNDTYLNLSYVDAQGLVKGIERILAQNATIPINATANVNQRVISPPISSQSHALTAIFVSTYAVCVVLFSLYECVAYRWEIMIFNRHMDCYLNLTHKSEDCGVITSQQRAREFTKKLIFTMYNTPVYWVSNWAGARENKRSPHWQRLMHFLFWMWSSSGYFWLLLLATVVHWQVYSSMMRACSRELARQETTWPENANHTRTLNLTSIYPLVFQECTEFETHLFETLNNSVAHQLWSKNGTLSKTLDSINSQMNTLVHTVDVAAPPQWRNLSLSEVAYPPVLDHKNSSSLCVNVVRHALSHKTSTKISEQTSFISNLPRHATHLHQWALVALLVTMATHHLLGLVVFTRLY